MKTIYRLSILSAACALAGLHASVQAAAGFVSIPVQSGANTTIEECSPKLNLNSTTETQNANDVDCRVDGLPGSSALPGYILKSSTSSNIVINSIIVGVLYDRVWCLGTGSTCNSSNTYILGTRARMNANTWSGTNSNTFEINDFFRVIRSGAAVEIAYFMGTVTGGTNADTAAARKYLEYSGRTLQGLFEPSTSAQQNRTKVTNNGWIDFRADANINDPDANPPYSYSSEWSPWLLVRQNCPSGYNATQQTNKARLWEGGEEGQSRQEILKTAYVCN